MRIARTLASLGLVAALSAGCVSQEKYDEVCLRMKERDAACVASEAKAREQARLSEMAMARADAAQKEAALLQAKLEGHEIQASLHVAGETTLAAGAPLPLGQEERGEPCDASLPVNPASGGIVLDGALLFPPGSAVLRPAAEPVLAKLALALVRPETVDLSVRVEGHTDDQPIQKSKFRDNWDLSGERALAVLGWLEAHGVAPDRLSFAGFGSSRPLAIAGKDARAQNRRVEVLLVKRRL